jgi:hypothetical protein
MAELQVECLSAEELAALDGHMQIVALAEICAELAALGKVAKAARHARTDAQKTLLRDPRNMDCRDAVLETKTIQLDVADRVRLLRDYKSIMQTILRGTPV